MMCDVIAEPSDLVYSDNRNGPSTEGVSQKQGLDKEPLCMT